MSTDYILYIYTILVLCIFTFLFIKNIKIINELIGIDIEKKFSDVSNSFVLLFY